MATRRRVTGAEEAELLAAARELDDAEATVIRARDARDRIIARLIDEKARPGDVAEILGLKSTRAVQDAAERGRRAD